MRCIQPLCQPSGLRFLLPTAKGVSPLVSILRCPIFGLDAELLVKLPIGAGENLECEIDIRSLLLGTTRTERYVCAPGLDADSTDVLGRELHGEIVRYDVGFYNQLVL